MSAEDPAERPEAISTIINGLERYNPEAVVTLEAYLAQQCEERFIDCNANRTLLKLYQLNPDRIKDEVITNILVKAMTQFPSPQFNLALHLISPAAASTTAAAAASSNAAAAELAEAISKLRALNNLLEGAEYARFWATLDSDDLYADLTTDIDGFEEMVRVRIAQLVSHAFREIQVNILEQWLGLSEEAVRKFVTETCGWKIDAGGSGPTVQIPKNPENEAKKTEIREDVSIDMFSRVVRRAWEESV